MPLWLIETRNTTTFIEKKISVVKEEEKKALRMAAIFAPALSASVSS
jgi:hypothetical protein